jgi:hypothetical protein
MPIQPLLFSVFYGAILFVRKIDNGRRVASWVDTQRKSDVINALRP